MCGIVGMFSSTALSNSEIDLFKGLLAVDIIRGSHATGVIKVNTFQNKVSMHKRAVDAYDFLAMAETKEFFDKDRGNILIGHNRYATMGDKADHQNAHPFQQDHITMVHNGGVSAWGLDLLEGYNEPGVVVDSHMVAKTIAAHGIKKAVTEKLDGAFALVWWDSKEKSLNFIRNTDRPLYLAVLTGGTVVWASEKGMLDVYCDRASRSGPKYDTNCTPILLDNNKLISFKFDSNGKLVSNKPHAEEIVFLDLPVPQSAYGNWGVYTGNSGYYQSSSQSNLYGSQSGSNAAYDARERKRVNDALKGAGINLQKGAIITCDVTAIESYSATPDYCKVIAKDRVTGTRVQVWGMVVAEVKNAKVVRCSVSNAYTTINRGVADMTITGEDCGLSCMDEAYDHTSHKLFTTQQEHSKKKYSRPAVTYPFKVQGHTFMNSIEFEDFVCQGCSICGEVPSSHDRRNSQLSVMQTARFSGLLSECEFICGKCEESA